MSEVDDIRARGWTQGSILAVNAGAASSGLKKDARYVVISHPCEVASPSLDRDPTVELLRVSVVDGVDGNLTFGKNPRRLQLAAAIGTVEFDFAGKTTVDRTILAGIGPELTISEADRRVLASWLAAKYARPAFADEFNLRMRPALSAIERVLKSAGSRISGIYIATSLSELASDANYQLYMAFTMLSADFDAPATFASVSEGVDRIEASIRGLAGIELVEIGVYSEAEFTLDALRSYARWDFDALSHKESEESAFPTRW